MRTNFSFSTATFCALPPQQQHKKCAELLKALVLASDKESLQDEYLKLCRCLDLAPLSSFSLEVVEERFHYHMRQTGLGIGEHRFLKSLSVKDKEPRGHWTNVHTFLDGLRSAHNVGSILRTVEAFRLGPVHLSSDMMPVDHKNVRSTSMGAWEHVPLDHGLPIVELPTPWIALETVEAATPWNEWIYPKECTLVVGNEERGIRRDLLQRCHVVVSIPLYGHKNSLNVANAFAILASEISSQQRRSL